MRKRSMTVGEVREALDGVPDDVELRVHSGVVDTLQPVLRVRASRAVVDVSGSTVEVEYGSDEKAGTPVTILSLTR